MKFRIFALAAIVIVATHGFAQRFEAGVFGGFGRTDLPGIAKYTAGIGGRVDLPLHKYFRVEMEGGYDFRAPKFDLTQVNSTTNASVTLTEARLKAVRANGGLKIQSHGGSYFFFLKGGGDVFMPDVKVKSINGFPPTITLISDQSTSFTKGVFYPGGGISFYAGPIGIRLDVGDEIFWINGDTHNNLRINLGPVFKF
ncbi:MAG TPA: hypothetical protein VKZ53_24600 [Candidatus Angelobacter sp.]|nr:hypothetical protein [Candidatus Angelobacter sp.]